MIDRIAARYLTRIADYVWRAATVEGVTPKYSNDLIEHGYSPQRGALIVSGTNPIPDAKPASSREINHELMSDPPREFQHELPGIMPPSQIRHTSLVAGIDNARFTHEAIAIQLGD